MNEPISSEENNMKRNDTKGYVWYTLSTDSNNEYINVSSKKMPKLSSAFSKPRPTAEEIQDKLNKADQRRKEKMTRRSQRTMENRESMIKLSKKIDKLLLHQEALTAKRENGKVKCGLMPKKEYCKTAMEVSEAFEGLSKRYEQDVARAKQS